MKSSSIVLFLLFLIILFTLSSFRPILADLNSDKQALLLFEASISHPKRLNWNDSTKVCSSWIGITCDPNRTRVVSLRLPAIGLAGKIPPNTISKLDALKVLSLRSNFLSGRIPPDVASIPSLRFLFLQHNNLSGELPGEFSRQLAVLDLSFNSLSGNIPAAIGNLTRLAKLDLQNNLISGSIPSLSPERLKVLDLSHNDLNGSVPGSLRDYPVSSFLGNSLLCGPPLDPCPILISDSYSPAPRAKRKLGLDSIIAIVIGALAGSFLVALVIFIRWSRRKARRGEEAPGKGEESAGAGAGGGGRKEKPKVDFGSGVHDAEKNKLFFFPGCSYSFDLEDLLRASAEILGKGNNGTTYKAVLDEGSTTVVVKRLKEVSVGKKEFEQQMECVAGVGPEHPNVVQLKAYYYSKDEKLLVYNYMPAGSLFAHLHGFRGAERSPLNWETRVKITLGAARGIAQIHSSGGAKSVHGNIKSSNILLTQDLDAAVSDFGLRHVTHAPAVPAAAISRFMGYSAPESLDPSRRLTQKSDVYSFGVVVLEMLTGKIPIRHPGQHHRDAEVADLPRWVRSVVREEWTAEVFDVEILRQCHVEEEMVQMLQIGLACVSKVPESRPNMDDVARMIQEVGLSNSKSSRPSSDSDYSNIQTP